MSIINISCQKMMKNLSKNNSDKNNDNNTAEQGVYNQKNVQK